MLKKLGLKSIRWYQKKGGSTRLLAIECNFEPSCSQYTYEAIDKYGFFKGVKLGWNRIKRCSDPNCVHKTLDELE